MMPTEDEVISVRKRYGNTVREVLSHAGESGIYEVLGAIEVLVGSKIYQGAGTTLAERMVFAFAWLKREVEDGGFDQFFENSAGDFWKDILDGLELVGDKGGVECFKVVLSIFPNGTPAVNRDVRQDQLEALDEQDEEGVARHFETMTKEYFKRPFPDWGLVFDYVRLHPEEFEFEIA